MSGIEASSGAIPAPYGRACVNCARAKCRCVYRAAEVSCERCHRLKKQCEPSVTVRKRRGGSRVASRTAQLEEKLEDLVSLLRNQGTVLKPPAAADATSGTTTHEPSPPALWLNTPAPSHGSQSDTAAAGSRDARSDSNPRPRFPLNPQTTVDVSNSAFIPGLFNHPAARPVPIESMIQQPWIPATPRQAEEHLRLFRDQYLQCCPCIYIPPDTTSEQLRKEKPFSWFTIMMMACQTSSLQFAMGGVWQDIVAQKIIVEHEKDLDLLQGMVIFLIWSHYHKKDKPYLGVFSQVALSHVYDLALNKLPADPLTFFTCKKGTAFDHSVHPRPTTMEDRRTVLACWCITSHLAFALKKTDGLRWTPHLSDCLDYLDEHPEWPGDRILASQVRIQHLIEQGCSDGQSAPLPAYFQPSALCSPVEALKKQLPPELEMNGMLRAQLVYAELVFLEGGLARTPYSPEKPDLRRSEILSRLGDAVARYFARFWPLFEEADPSALSFAAWCQMTHGLMTLAKLSMLDEPAWDRAALRRDVDLFEVCDRLIRGMDATGLRRRSEAAGLPAVQRRCVTNFDIFSTCARMIGSMKNAWAAELAALEPDAAAAAPAAARDQQPPRLPDNGYVDNNAAAGGWNVPISFLDDAWLTDLMSVPWE